MCHVLIIEDEALVALGIQDILSSAGAESFSFAETEADALAAARLHRPDMITSDVMLREGTGPRAVAAIQRELGPLPVMFITASPDQCEPCDAPARVLAKPVSHNQVRAAFRDLRRTEAHAAG